MLDYKSIGQRCTWQKVNGKQCRLPAYTIAGGLAVCPYHIGHALRLWRKVKDALPTSVRRSAEKDSTYL